MQNKGWEHTHTYEHLSEWNEKSALQLPWAYAVWHQGVKKWCDDGWMDGWTNATLFTHDRKSCQGTQNRAWSACKWIAACASPSPRYATASICLVVWSDGVSLLVSGGKSHLGTWMSTSTSMRRLVKEKVGTTVPCFEMKWTTSYFTVFVRRWLERANCKPNDQVL